MKAFGSLFAGIGGFDRALESVGYRPAYQVEIDQQCQDILAHHWPEVPRHDDITTFHPTAFPVPHILCGGFPCQDLSVAGNRAGLAGERSGLWFEFWRVIRQTLPRWIIIENVPGLLSSNAGRDFAIVLGGLTGRLPGVPRGGWRNGGFAAGREYSVAWRVLDAQAYGVPQRRRRVFLVASLGDDRCSQVLLESEGLPGDLESRREARPELARDVAACLRGGSGKSDVRGWRSDAEVGLVAYPRREVIAFAWQQGDDSKHGKDGRGRSWVARAGDYTGSLSTTRHDAVAGPAYGVRRLTPTECERLQGLPDSWTSVGASGTTMADAARYRMLGNAVCTPVVAWIARRIAAAESVELDVAV